MADSENFISQIPQPRFGHQSPSRILGEITSSAKNARNGTMLPPPPGAGHKRQGSSLAESAPKRKTLAERAGEPIKSNFAAPRSITPVNSAVMSLTQYRNPSTSSSLSQSYRSNSISSRSTSNSSFSASVGSGIRPPSAQSFSGLARPKTSLAKDRAIRKADSRPATSMGTRVGVHEAPQNTRMAPISSSPYMCVARSQMAQGPFSEPKSSSQILSASHDQDQQLFQQGSVSKKRDISIASHMQSLTLNEPNSDTAEQRISSPSRIPRLLNDTHKHVRIPPERPPYVPPAFPKFRVSSPSKTKTHPSPSKNKSYLTKDSNTETWDPEEQYAKMERIYHDVVKHYKVAAEDNVDYKEANSLFKSTITNLEQERATLTESVIQLRIELENVKYCLGTSERARETLQRNEEEKFDDMKREFKLEIDSIRQSHRDEIDHMKDDHRDGVDCIKRDHKDEIDHIKGDHRDQIKGIQQRYEEDLENERTQRIQALSQASVQGTIEKQKQQITLEAKDTEIRTVRAELDRNKVDFERERALNENFRKDLSSAGTNFASMENARQALQAKIEYLESDSKSQSEAYAAMERRMNEAIETSQASEEKLRKEETLRRKLHNQVQELKGNIRVFCRVRPTNNNDEAEETAKISFPDLEDQKDIEVKGLEEVSSLGKVTTKSHPFSFDRVFDPASNNTEIFGEISQLIQSALDGYNVCIFAYGQTGSGKTFTMSSEDGMIPQALRQIYTTSKELGSRGWSYTMEGSFVEVYNEEIRDLLGKEGDYEKGNKKHEIRHDMVKCETTITDVTTLSLDSQDQVEEVLTQAMSRRSVAATKANERSSRSHSIFILKLVGQNSITGESSKGTLNLVDLAGSERLSQSKVEGARLKETQNINKSLSCLGDVIGALGQQQNPAFNPRDSTSSMNNGNMGAHIPYRNSKLTYLLQFSLGGNSKTLMFVMVAPEKKCLAETLTSLKFADKVSKTRIGVARKAK